MTASVHVPPIQAPSQVARGVDVKLHMLGSFDFGDHGGGAAHETRVWVLSNRSML